MNEYLWGGIAPHLNNIKPLDQIEVGKFITIPSENGLRVKATIVTESDSLIGPVFRIPFDYGRDTLLIQTRDHYYQKGEWVPIPNDWNRSQSGEVSLVQLPDEFAFGIRPSYQPLESKIVLENQDIVIKYLCQSEESSFYLFREKGAPWIGIAPLSSQNPWKPNLTVSAIEATIHLGN